MVKHTLKILQQMLQDFKSVFDHFETLRIKGLWGEILSENCHLTLVLELCDLFWNIYGSYESLMSKSNHWKQSLYHNVSEAAVQRCS